jgi:Mrp family chromosome partitioning ATPase
VSEGNGHASGAFEGVASRMRSADLRAVGFTGAVQGDGASTLALGTSLSLAALDAGTVLLVDANWLHPALTADAGLGSRPGLAEVLRGDTDFGETVHATVRPRLVFLAAGALDGDRPFLTLSAFMDRALSQFSAVVADLPPALAGDFLLLPWAAELQQIFVVARSGVTPLALVRRAVQEVGVARSQVVLNRIPMGPAGWTAPTPLAVT